MTTDTTVNYEAPVVIAFFVLWMCIMPAVAAAINTPTRCNLALLLSRYGSKSLKIITSNTKDNVSGYTKANPVRVKPHQNCTPSMKDNNTGGTSRPGVRAVEIDGNKKWLQQEDSAFSKGTDNWIWKQITFRTAISAGWAYGGAHEL